MSRLMRRRMASQRAKKPNRISTASRESNKSMKLRRNLRPSRPHPAKMEMERHLSQMMLMVMTRLP